MSLPSLSRKTIFELQEFLTNWTLGEIDGLFGSADSCQWTRIVTRLVNPNCYEA